LWVWSFIFLIVLLMLNMVLAIILDIYNEVREASLSSETVFTTLWNYCVRMFYMHHWVPDVVLDDCLENEIDLLMVSRVDIKKFFPNIPEKQLELMYGACTLDERAEAERQLDKCTCLKMTGSIKMTADTINESIKGFITDTTPLKTFTDFKHDTREQAKLQMLSRGFFLGQPPKMKGNRHLELLDPSYYPATMPELDEGASQWKKDLYTTLRNQRKWMLWIDWQLQDALWNLHMAHFTQLKSDVDDVKRSCM